MFMENSRFKILIAVLASAALVSGGLLVFILMTVTIVTPAQLRNDALFVYDSPIILDEFSLTNQDEEVFTNESLQGRWSLIFFGYTYCPDICPITLASIKQFYDLLKDSGDTTDVQVIMVSVDPERDTSEVLGNYVRYFNPDFIGATGDYTDVYRMARNMNLTFNYTRIDDDNYLVNHNGEVMLIDPLGNNVGFLKPPYEPQKMLDNFQAIKSYSESLD